MGKFHILSLERKADDAGDNGGNGRWVERYGTEVGGFGCWIGGWLQGEADDGKWSSTPAVPLAESTCTINVNLERVLWGI